MRRRLLAGTVAAIAAALVAFAVPLGVAVRNLLTTRALDALEAEVQPVASFVAERARTCEELRLFLSLTPEGGPDLSVFNRSGRLVASQGADPVVTGEVASAARGRVARNHAAGRLAVAVPLSTRACGAPLVLHAQRADDPLTSSVRRAWVGIALVGLAVLGLAAGGAWWLGRRLAVPFERLAESARRLGEGDFTATAPRSGLPEADAIAVALDTTAARLGRALERGRAFTSDASHQLRTPLTALRLRLDALAAGDADDDQVAAAHREADRLEHTVEELVALTGLQPAAGDVDVGDLVADRVDALRPLAARQDRAVIVDRREAPPARVRPAAVGQALQVLLDNALEHGRGTITVRVGPARPDDAESRGVRVEVVDQGPGVPDPHAERGGEGRGLELARSLIRAEGGRLTLRSDAGGTRAGLLLPSGGGAGRVGGHSQGSAG